MNKPKVSILLPNLNNRPYLEERLQTIREQTMQDWELIIVDNYSDDGAWEYFQDCPGKDPRIKISQAPRAGMYANWNNCIRLAKGEYVYIATSDDTMSPNFLEIMVGALDQNPDCDLAHCKLRIIDEKGNKNPELSWDKFYCTVYFADLINKKHIRFAPHDGLLHCGVGTVYTSITQLLIRRSLFNRIGLFLTGYGSTADFEWEMRASLVADTIHIPEYLATWRVHRAQGTDRNFLESANHYRYLLEMIEHAFKAAKKIKPGLLKGINLKELKYLYTKKKFRSEFTEQNNRMGRYKTGLKWLFANPKMLIDCFRSVKIEKKSFIAKMEPIDFSKEILKKYGFEKNLGRIENWALGNPDKIAPGISSKQPPILIYQMSKVGSKTVYYSLKEHSIPNMLFHVHQLRYDCIYSTLKKIERRINNIKSQKVDNGVKVSRILYNKNLQGMLNNDLKLRNKFAEYKRAFNWKIITLVRDPISRMLSDFYFSIQTKHPEATDFQGNIILEKSIAIFKKTLNRFNESKDWTCRWFEEEFKKVLEVDAYDYPFNHKKGYTIIKSRNIEILIIKMEEMDNCFVDAVSDFLGFQNIKMVRKNIAAKKSYADVYREARKNIRIKRTVCEKIYTTKFARHFYSEEERESFTRKWSQGIPNHQERKG